MEPRAQGRLQQCDSNCVEKRCRRLTATHQSLQPIALDDATRCCPPDFSVPIARNTQLFPATGTDTCDGSFDAWGGSYYVEKLTHDLAQTGLEHLAEVDAAGA